MIDAEELVLELDSGESQSNFKLATVTALFANKTAKLQFDGEDVASEKQYAYLESYTPKINDRVLLGVLGGTYVILGKVNYNVAPPAEADVDRYLFDLKQVIMQKGLSVTGATELKSGASVTGNLTVSSNVNAGSFSTSGNVSAANLSATGEVSMKTILLTTAPTSWSTGTSIVTSSLRHTGSTIGFFNKAPTVKTSLYPFNTPSTVTLVQAVNAINNIVSALNSYGLL